MYNTLQYDVTVKQLRNFFQDKKGFIEVPAQSRLSILAACEDPKTISVFDFNDVKYPLPQTGQMWLEYELLKNPTWPGVFCVTTSYRNEPNPIPGRHEKIFPMFEFESHGDINILRKLEKELLAFLRLDAPLSLEYDAVANYYGVSEITAHYEELLCKERGSAILLEKFPLRTHPFWNMKRLPNDLFAKIDVILYGMETIGSAERSCNKEEMRDGFFSISNGQYAQLLFNAFGKERVVKELDEYLSHTMIPRFGGGIGVTRLARALEKASLIDTFIPASMSREHVFSL